MYFKSLEMLGFKSFADKTKINFERGITTIVGPNGCGKSNIADAVKWVLGEQSAKALRGSHMEDMIFSGTDQREPLGYAEVSLTLSNEAKFLPIEYNEVIISRRLYRSGESEYLLNKNAVRLKDITELLMGSGMGTSCYSILEQGKIDQILSANPDDRRIVFEEASGITKYKTKKREAIRKLEETEQNLLRVNDIIKEVERQINSIERQAKKARRYQELFEKLKGLDTKLGGARYKELKEKRDALKSEKSIIKERENELLLYTNKFNEELSSLKSKEDNLNARIAQFRKEGNDADVALQKDQDKVNLNRERSQELYKYQADYKQEITSLEARIKDASTVIDDITKRLTDISKNTKSKENLLIVNEKDLATLKDEMVNKEESIKANKFMVVDVLAAQSKLRNELTRIASDMQNVSARLRRLNIEKDNVSKELATLEKGLSNARLAVNMVISKIETLEKERIELQNDLKNEKEAEVILEKKIDDSKNYILSLHSKLNLLKDMLKRHEGFIGGTQALLNKLSLGELKLEGSCEPLAELLEPKRGYEAACEAALMEYLQTVVVDNWKTAFKALGFLKNNELGKASFIKNESPPEKDAPLALNNPLIRGNMIDFIRFDSRYRYLFHRLLKKVFLVESIEDAVSVLKNVPDDMRKGLKLVTKKGDIITEDVVTGGSPVRDFTSSIVGRRMRIKEIEDDIVRSEKEALGLKQGLQAKRDSIEDLQNRLKTVEGTLRVEEIDLAEKKSAEANLEKEYKRINEELDLINLETDESMLGQNELKDKERDLKSRLEEEGNEEMRLQDSITAAQRFIEEGLKKKEGLLVAITQIQMELLSLKAQEDEIYNRAQSQKDYYEEQLRLLDTKKNLLEESYKKEKELKEEIENLEIDIQRLKERESIIEEELSILEKEALQLKEEIDNKEQDYNKKKEEIDAIKDKTHSINMQESQLTFQMETLRNKIGQLYKVDLEEVISNLEKIDDMETLQNEVNDLSQAVEKMGPVNLVVIDEHKELEERFTFLKHQEEDLLNAKDSLLKAIRKINQTTRHLFMETFASIQTEFKNYFRFLFGGGKAEIVLLDENDVLESGIEIIVRPPGKKLQTISLLSGGERALTAIALLFAIFKVRPSPFCLLDEIDAPLDESNIGRFSKVLQEFAKDSQFIIITHNKKTIGISDIMYGITMEQSGISKIISVKFADRAKKEEEPVLA